jgi:hypothetical protein
MHSLPNLWFPPRFVPHLRRRPPVQCLCHARNAGPMETPPRRATTPLCQIKRPRARVQPVERVATVIQTLTNLHGRVLAQMPQTHNLPIKTEPRVSMTETVTHLYDVKMTATVPLTTQSTIHPMKRAGSPTHVAPSHGTMHVTATMTGTGTGITIMQVTTVLTELPQGLQDILQMTCLWIGRAQSIGSPMNPTLVVPVIVKPHLLERTALAVFYEGTTIPFMILMTKVLGIMVIHLVVLGLQNALGTLNPLAGAPTPSSCGILTPRTRVQVDHRL